MRSRLPQRWTSSIRRRRWLYRRIGFLSGRHDDLNFDSNAAIEMGRVIARELRHATPRATTP